MSKSLNGCLDFWALEDLHQSPGVCSRHLGAVALPGQLRYTRMYGEMLSGYIEETGHIMIFDWKVLVEVQSSFRYYSQHVLKVRRFMNILTAQIKPFPLLQRCDDSCQISNGQILTIEENDIVLYSSPSFLLTDNLHQPRLSVSSSPVWRYQYDFPTTYSIIVPIRSYENEQESLATLFTEQHILRVDGAGAILSQTPVGDEVMEFHLGHYRAATVRWSDGVLDGCYFQSFSMPPPISLLGVGSEISAEVLPHREVKLCWPNGMSTEPRQSMIRMYVDELSGRMCLLVHGEVFMQFNILCYDFI